VRKTRSRPGAHRRRVFFWENEYKYIISWLPDIHCLNMTAYRLLVRLFVQLALPKTLVALCEQCVCLLLARVIPLSSTNKTAQEIELLRVQAECLVDAIFDVQNARQDAVRVRKLQTRLAENLSPRLLRRACSVYGLFLTYIYMIFL